MTINLFIHEHVWAQMWTSAGTEIDPPPDVPITCLICGAILEKPKERGMEGFREDPRRIVSS